MCILVFLAFDTICDVIRNDILALLGHLEFQVYFSKLKLPNWDGVKQTHYAGHLTGLWWWWYFRVLFLRLQLLPYDLTEWILARVGFIIFDHFILTCLWRYDGPIICLDLEFLLHIEQVLHVLSFVLLNLHTQTLQQNFNLLPKPHQINISALEWSIRITCSTTLYT